MDSIAFSGFVTGVRQNLVAGTLIVKLEARLKNITEADREKLGVWAGMDEPKVDLVIAHPSPSKPGVELEGDLISAKTNLATHRLMVGIKIASTDVQPTDEELLADLGRYLRPAEIEIKTSQMTF